MGSGCLTLNAGSSSSGYCRCCRRLKRHALCGTSLAASCCGSLCRSKHSPQCHRQICCCLSARSWPLAVHQCQRRARGSRYRRRRHNSRRSHARSSPVAVVHNRRPAGPQGPQEPNRPGTGQRSQLCRSLCEVAHQCQRGSHSRLERSAAGQMLLRHFLCALRKCRYAEWPSCA